MVIKNESKTNPMQVFTRRKHIQVNLDDIELEQLTTFPNRNKVDIEEFYLKEVFSKDHVQFGMLTKHLKGVHDFEYDRDKKELIIFSRLEKSALGIYMYLSLPLLLLFFGDNTSEANKVFIGMFMAFFLFLSLLLILGIKIQSQEIEREMVIRINYFRGKIN